MVVPSLASDVVVAGPAEEPIVTASAIEVILAAVAKQKVGSVEAIEVVAVVRPRAFDPSKRPNPHGCKTSWRFSIRPENLRGRFENRELCPFQRH
jgi:hypothetical protein